MTAHEEAHMEVKDFTRPPQAVRPAAPQPDCVDHAPEHLRMQRGRYSAWVHVVAAFAIQTVLVTWVWSALWATARVGPSVAMALYVTGLALGIAVAVWTFWDHWRVVEAFSSRFCSGIANLSLLYVPLVAWVYANYRFVRRVAGR